MPLINETLADAGANYSMLDAIAVTRGPGAFTGMRIGLSTAKALGLAADKPVCGVTTFDAVLHSFLLNNEVVDASVICILLETKRKDYYFQAYDGKSYSPISEPLALGIKEVCSFIVGYCNIIVVGDVEKRFKKELDGALGEHNISFVEILQPSSAGISKAAEFQLRAETTSFDSRPCYLRNADVSISKKHARILR